MLYGASLEKLALMLSLPTTGQEQDWDIELADESRLGEFLAAYDRPGLTNNDRIALMALMVASVDRYIEARSSVPDEWRTIANILVTERSLHADTLSYWKCEDATEQQEQFHVTPLIRDLAPDRPR